jgi:hypothetical protein
MPVGPRFDEAYNRHSKLHPAARVREADPKELLLVNIQERARSFKRKACEKCGGDAFFDGGVDSEWRCLQCGRPLMSYDATEAEAVRLRTSAVIQVLDRRRARLPRGPRRQTDH